MEFIFGRTETDTKVSGKVVSNMAKELISSATEIFTLDITNMGNLKVTVSIYGKMGLCMKVISKLDLNMVKVNGKRIRMKLIVINTKENTKMMLSMVLVYSNGNQGMNIKENIKMMKEKDLVRSNG
jgi:hypothetical protein